MLNRRQILHDDALSSVGSYFTPQPSPFLHDALPGRYTPQRSPRDHASLASQTVFNFDVSSSASVVSRSSGDESSPRSVKNTYVFKHLCLFMHLKLSSLNYAPIDLNLINLAHYNHTYTLKYCSCIFTVAYLRMYP